MSVLYFPQRRRRRHVGRRWLAESRRLVRGGSPARPDSTPESPGTPGAHDDRSTTDDSVSTRRSLQTVRRPASRPNPRRLRPISRSRVRRAHRPADEGGTTGASLSSFAGRGRFCLRGDMPRWDQFALGPLYALAMRLRGALWRARRPLLVGVRALIVRDGAVLLGRHRAGRRPWALPGGGVRRFERLEETARRPTRPTRPTCCSASTMPFTMA